jgi:hypothetical protein
MFSVEPTTKPQTVPITNNFCFAVDVGHCKSDSEDMSSMGFSTPSKDEITATKRLRSSHS